jgi:uncharacterized protein YkwD
MRIALLGMLATFGLLSSCVPISEDDPDPNVGAISCDQAATEAEKLECRVAELVNAERQRGAVCDGTSMPPAAALTMHSALRQSARGHAEDMAAQGYFSHESLDGRTPYDRMEAAGYTFSAAAENIAAGSPTPEDVMQQWMASGGHCRNIMSGSYLHIGVGYAVSESTAYRYYWVQNFGAPL